MNLELEIRELLVLAWLHSGLYPDPSYIFSTTALISPEGDLGEPDNYVWFWQQLEEKYNCPVTKAQRESLKTVGDLIRYMKIRLAVTA